MIRKYLLIFLLIFGTIQSTISSPAYPKAIKFTQPDGTTITIMLKGDEHTKWAVTSDGYTLLSNSKGYFEYATNNRQGDLVPSGVVAKNIENRTVVDKLFLSKISKGISYSKEQLQILRSISNIKRSEAKKAFPTTGNRKLICILMGFKDKPFSKTQTDFDNLFNQLNYTVNGATGSVKDFYLENSYNKFNLTVTVAGSYTASQNMSYYGANDANGYDVKPDVLVTEAVTLADPDINYADFDNDSDGNVDGVYVIYAGYGEEAGAPANTIWAHAWEIPATTLDGKVITSYSCSAELEGTSGSTMTAIGVICHEFGHVLGAPDYYDTDYDTGGQYEGTGYWDLMAAGSWNNNGITPAHHNAYTKTMVYGWGTATTLINGTTITIPSSKTDENAFYRINTATANEYYLIENHQQTGFDLATPGHGLLIFHVNKDIDAHYSGNDINAEAPQLMYPVCASATTNPSSTATSYGSINTGGCPFPGTSSKNSFTDATTPSMKSWLGVATNKPITNISEDIGTGVITFDFDGGNTGNPTGFTATPTSGSQIDLTWSKSENRDVVIAYSTTSTFGSLIDGTEYTAAQSITGGGTVLFSGDASAFSHTGLNSNTTYFYKAWTKLTTSTYSLGTITQAKTACTGIVSLPLSEDFNTGVLSGCWSIIDNQGNAQTWQIGNITNGLTGTYIYLDSDAFGTGNTQNTDLVTPTIDMTSISSATISFKHYFKVEAGETATFSYSIDNGANWTQIDQWATTITNPSNYKKILTSIANQSSVKFKWNYTGTYGWYWCLDDISIAETTAADAIADFKAEPTTVIIDATTTFTDLSSGTVTSWAWDFGSGATPATATTAGPHTVTYSTAGKKTVTLTINGSVTETKTDYITVVDPNAPVVIVGWNFEDSDDTADDGISANSSKTLTTNSTGTISYTTGSGGTGTYAITNTGWDNGNASKAWQTEFSTLGYNTLTISSKQKSSNTGPKEFKIQYKTTGPTWIDIPSSNITIANDFVSGVLTNLVLPIDAANQPSVSLRWVMRSNLQVGSGSVASGGTSRIDDIVVNGKIIVPPIQYTLTVAKIGNGTVTPTIGDHNYDTGTSVTLTATPDQGWQFDKWEINGNTVNSASTQITINAITTATATFSLIPTYKLTVSHVGNGTVSPVDGESTHNTGASVTLTATPDQGWQFDKWEINGNTVNSASTQITINAITTATATFSVIPTYKLTVSHVGNGTVSPVDGESTHNAGESVTLTATPDQGWQFDKREINGNTVNSASTQITINVITTATATFSLIPTYKLTVSHVGNGTVSPVDGESTHNAGESVTLTATPDQGWQFDKWEINGNTVNSASTQITINAITTATAIFSLIPATTYKLTVSHVGNGAVSPVDGESTHNAGASVTLTATPDQGWQFDKWEINGNTVSSASTQITINANTTATATFSLIPATTYKLTVSHVGNGSVSPVDGESTHNAGASVTLTATPDQGWQFDKWEINGNTVNSASTQITINANTTATATFSLVPVTTYKLTVSHVGNGTVSPVDGESTHNAGASVTLTATPDNGWRFDKWEISGIIISNASTQITMNTNITATATFSLINSIELIENNVKFYPNPTNSSVNIESGSIIKYIEVMDLTGRVLFTSDLILSTTSKVDLSNIQSGYYLIRVFDTKNRIQVIKVSKQ